MQKQQGFTLVELAVSLVVIGLVLGMVSLPLMRQLNDRLGRVPGGQDAQDIQAALAMYMQTMGRLPCGSADAGGVENAGLSGRKVQFLPWKTLGLPAGYDKYGSMFGYVVDPGICSVPVQWSSLLDQSPVVNVEFWELPARLPAMRCRWLSSVTARTVQARLTVTACVLAMQRPRPGKKGRLSASRRQCCTGG